MCKSRLILIVLGLFFISLFCISGFVSAEELKIADILKRGYLKVAICGTVHNYCLKTPDGKIEGFDNDITRLLAKAMFEDENKFEYLVVTGAGRIPSIVTRKADVCLGCTNITPDRAMKVAFTIPYHNAGQHAVVRRDAKVERLEDLNREGIKIAISGAPFYAKLVDTYFPKATKVTFEILTDALMAVRAGRAQAMLNEMYAAKAIAKGDKSLMVIEGFVGSPMNIGMLVNLEDREWPTFLNTFISELTTGYYLNEYKAMHIKWFGVEPKL
jgi:polar amino acid transport system substrate-binding protein